MQIFPTRLCNVTSWRHSSLANGHIVAGAEGGIPLELQRLLSLIGYCNTGGVCGRSLTAGKILFTGRQTCSLYLVLWLCVGDAGERRIHTSHSASSPPPQTIAISQWARSLEWCHAVTLYILVGENLHQFLPILLWRHALSSSIMTLWLNREFLYYTRTDFMPLADSQKRPKFIRYSCI